MITSDHLTTALTAAGAVPDDWMNTFAKVDRALFVPSRCWFDDENGDLQPIDRDVDPDRWLAAVYSDEPVVTQLAHGSIQWPNISPLITSSASQPSMVLIMLDALDLHDGDRTLEIGTGTGYNAALLAQRLGDGQVTTMEVDPVLADQARASLAAAGHRPTVICGDGALGWPARAPYDRIVVRHEAPCNRVGVRDLHHSAVAAAG